MTEDIDLLALLDENDRLREALRPLAELPEASIRDYEQGYCIACNEGWERVPGPRGGKGELKHTNRHADDCPFVAARAALESSGGSGDG